MAIEIKPSHKGLLHKKLGVPQGKPIPDEDLTVPHGHNQNALALKKEIVFARNARKWNHKKAA